MEYPILLIEREDNTKIKLERLTNVKSVANFVSPRSSGEFDGKALYLNMGYDWVLGRDSLGALVLVPLSRSHPDC